MPIEWLEEEYNPEVQDFFHKKMTEYRSLHHDGGANGKGFIRPARFLKSNS
eukprot:CAMPEP_0170469168 /NCGR_PEP_ID=MMETSP0123-20130129/12092_1 /TAXON_ID=182087 /ORGANISM="Favella ehrenbergii, Strain Fehren 1" /LENGTH=50 /DNA_ID=CAMNT_0010735955 /DNA_START=482 /DNA_END=634 /DNA_ORIENTATION=+